MMHATATTTAAPLRILEISASGRTHGATSRLLTAELITALESRHGPVQVTHRELADGVPFVDDAWIAANFTADEDRNSGQRDVLAYSDQLVAELQDADAIVLGTPIYNFSIPASLKAWIDMIARARLTFRYTENGPEGLLQGKKAYVVIASGGVAIGSDYDFASPYLRHVLAFVGITDVEFVAAEQLNSRYDDSIDAARLRIADLVFTSAEPNHQAA
jgi:FMN-dependent NADH-azoreductase